MRNRIALAATHGSPMIRFVLGRVASGVFVLLIVSILIFSATAIVPGDAATAFLGQNATPESVAALREKLDLDRPIAIQYLDWLTGFVRGDLGASAAGTVGNDTQHSIANTIRDPLVNTALLAFLAISLVIPISLTMGTFMAVRAGRASDHLFSSATIVGLSLPEFVTASLLIAVFAGALGWLPAIAFVLPGEGPLDHPQSLILPVATLVIGSLAYSVRQVRIGMIEVLRSDYVTAARLGGVAESRVLMSYGLRNGLAPSIQMFALTLMYLVGGIVITETIFAYPGLGSLLVNAVNTHDTPTVQSVALLLATLYIGLNIVADVLVMWLNPRLRP